MDNIFDIYSAKVDNDKVTEWNSNLLFPYLYAPTNPLDYRLCSSAEIWLFQTITDYYCHKGAFKTVKIRKNTLSFAVRAYQLFIYLSWKFHVIEAFRYRNNAQIKWITFLIYIKQKLTMIKLLVGTRTCYFPIDMRPPIH